MKDYAALKYAANTIRDEVEDGRNTAERVGGMLSRFVDSVKRAYDTKASIDVTIGKNLFNKNARRSVVAESLTSPTGYYLTDSYGDKTQFVNATQADTQLKDIYPDENIYCVDYNRYFGWMYDASTFTSCKIPFSEGKLTATFFNGGVEKTILAFDEDGNYLGYVATGSGDYAHVTINAADFAGVAYVRLSSCQVSNDPDAIQVETGDEATEYEAYSMVRAVPKNELPNDVLYSSSEAWQNTTETLEDVVLNKAPLSRVVGKNRFNKSAARSVVSESAGSATGYVLMTSSGEVVAFTNATQAETQLTDDKPDENIINAYFHRHFGWMYDASTFTSHKITMNDAAMTATFFNGGVEKSILAFDANGQYLGHIVTTSNDWAHATMLKSAFDGVAYIRVSNCQTSADMPVLQVEAGTTPTAYEAFKDESVVPKTALPSDVVYKSSLSASIKNEGAAKTLQSGSINIVAGHYNADGQPVIGSGNAYISDYVEIYGGVVYEFEYVNECRFYDANHDEIDGTALQSGFAYLAPENAKYMSVNFNGVTTIPYISVLIDDYSADTRSGDLNTLPSSPQKVEMVVSARRQRATYIIGDSEASNFHYNVTAVAMSKIVSSFGGHTTDFIATNVLQGTGGIGSLSHVNGCNVIVVAGTNDQSGAQNARLIAYHRELIHNLRMAGANEIFAISPFLDITRDPATCADNPFVGMLKRLYGGHYINVMQHVLDCGVYYNPYHPEAFTQPSVGGSVVLHFEDVSALTECGLVSVGERFWIRYYDDKADLYQCTAYSTANNTITAQLVTNGSDRAAGQTAGKYTESVATPAWSGTKTTLGWVYNEEDGQRIANGQIPACIYGDRSVHFGKIIGRIIEDMLGLYYDVLK